MADKTARMLSHRVRSLSAADLGLPLPAAPTAAPAAPAGTAPAPVPFDEHDQLLVTARELLLDFGGLILVGPPGTSKSHNAARLAVTLAGSMDRVRFTQFHPSYQYEDFIQGYVPENGSFEMKPKHLMQLCGAASGDEAHTYVLVIDELSRGEPGRIFGEALTYVERSKRGIEFHLASGETLKIPENLVFIATMNPLDRGVDEVDAAFERRFAKIAMDPDETILSAFLAEAGMDEPLRLRLLSFFRNVNGRRAGNPFTALGHTYFVGVKDQVGLRRVWEHQLRFLFDKAFRLDPAGLAEVERWWDGVMAPEPEPEPDETTDEAVGGADEETTN